MKRRIRRLVGGAIIGFFVAILSAVLQTERGGGILQDAFDPVLYPIEDFVNSFKKAAKRPELVVQPNQDSGGASQKNENPAYPVTPAVTSQAAATRLEASASTDPKPRIQDQEQRRVARASGPLPTAGESNPGNFARQNGTLPDDTPLKNPFGVTPYEEAEPMRTAKNAFELPVKP